MLRVAAAEGESAYGVGGMELALGGSKAGRVLERGRSERIDSLLDDPEVDQQATRRLGVHSALYVPLIVRGRADRGRDRSRQAGSDARLQRGRPAAGGVARRPGRDRRRSFRAGQPRLGPPGGRGAGARASAAGARAARRDRSGADVDPARAEAAGADGGLRGGSRSARRPSASSSSRRCRTCAGWRSSCARPHSTTSDSCRPSSA